MSVHITLIVSVHITSVHITRVHLTLIAIVFIHDNCDDIFACTHTLGTVCWVFILKVHMGLCSAILYAQCNPALAKNQ